MHTDGWKRAKRDAPCPICHRPNGEHKSTWCLYSRDGTVAICPFTPEGAIRNLGAAGYLHKLGVNSNGQRQEAMPRRTRPEVVTNWSALVDLYSAAARTVAVQSHAEWLGVSAGSLRRLHVGLCAPDVWTFPMSDGRGYCGIRTRTTAGEKKAFIGSRNGYFVPGPNGETETDVLYICEGPTDTAAMLTLGLSAIGRADCNTTRDADAICCGRRVVIMADRDAVGRAGAKRLQAFLAGRSIPAAVVVPPAKDIREWIRTGANAAAVRGLAAV